MNVGAARLGPNHPDCRAGRDDMERGRSTVRREDECIACVTMPARYLHAARRDRFEGSAGNREQDRSEYRSHHETYCRPPNTKFSGEATGPIKRTAVPRPLQLVVLRPSHFILAPFGPDQTCALGVAGNIVETVQEAGERLASQFLLREPKAFPDPLKRLGIALYKMKEDRGLDFTISLRCLAAPLDGEPLKPHLIRLVLRGGPFV
jgi:hypothetical protein